MPTQPLPQPLPPSPAESASHALRAALAERLAGRRSPYGEGAGGTLGVLAALPRTVEAAALPVLHGTA